MQTQSRNDALITAYIEADPNHPGADDVRLKHYGVSVWAIVGYWKANGGNIARVADGYGIPTEAVDAALAYYRRHQAAIENRLDANDPEAAERLAQSLRDHRDGRIRTWLEPDPRRGGADEVRLKNFCISVWAIVGYWKANGGDAARVASDYDVPVEAIDAALAWYQRHRDVIDARLEANVAD